MPTFLVAHLPYIKLIGITMLPPRSRPSSCRPYELSGLGASEEAQQVGNLLLSAQEVGRFRRS
jgi:hypothetical protein